MLKSVEMAQLMPSMGRARTVARIIELVVITEN